VRRRPSSQLFSLALALLLLTATGRARADDPPRAADQHFTIDPVSDAALIGASAGFSLLLSGILSTGEIHPSPLAPGDDTKLLSIDRLAVTQSIDPNADAYSNIGLYAAAGFAALDPILSGTRDGWDAGLVDAVLYAETVSLTEALTDMTKIAVRRPRPLEYIQCEHAGSSSACASTDVELSFFSGHAATVASITATATYLAFRRSPDSPRPWLTLALGTALSVFVDYERVRAGAHFPTDVLAGSLAGAAVGVLVPHLHRHTQDPPQGLDRCGADGREPGRRSHSAGSLLSNGAAAENRSPNRIRATA
jgi:membrane-associated phospholipid phosphatase